MNKITCAENTLVSIIKIEPEEFQDSNEKNRYGTKLNLDGLLQMKFYEKRRKYPTVLIEKLGSWSNSKRKQEKFSAINENMTNAISLAKKYNPGLINSDPHSCHICFEVYRSRQSLVNHLAAIHALAPKMLCDLCPKYFFHKTGIHQHMTAHMKKALTCNICDYKTAEKRGFKLHKLAHLKNEFCKICNKKVSSLKAHLFSHRPKVACPICQKEIQKYHLKLHLKRHEKNKCKDCSETFANPENLRSHVLRSHHRGKIYECHCGSVFGTETAWRSHKSRHRNSKVTCNLCGKIYAGEGTFRRHWKKKHFETHGEVRKKAPKIRRLIALNHNSPHVCDLCGKKCSNRAHFYNHVNMMHLQPEKYSRAFICDICGYKANLKASLKTHLLAKACRFNDCKICNKKVKNMATHMKYHRKY